VQESRHTKIALSFGLSYVCGVPRTYPLEALLRIREQERDTQARQFAEQSEKARGAEDSARQARSAHECALEETRRVEAGIRRQLDGGTTRAVDLEVGAAWRLDAREQLAQTRRRVTAAEETLCEQQAAQRAARQRWAAAEAQLQALEKHRTRWEASCARRAELLAEDEFLDCRVGRIERRAGRWYRR
jgi:hypothetical protein